MWRKLPRVSATLVLIACFMLMSFVHGGSLGRNRARNQCVKRHSTRGRFYWNTEYYPYTKGHTKVLDVRGINGMHTYNYVQTRGFLNIPRGQRLATFIDLSKVKQYNGKSYYPYNCEDGKDLIANRETGLCHLLNQDCKSMSREYKAHGCLGYFCGKQNNVGVTIRLRITCDGESMTYSVSHNLPGAIGKLLPGSFHTNKGFRSSRRYGRVRVGRSRLARTRGRRTNLPAPVSPSWRGRRRRRRRKLLQRQKGHC